MKVTVCEMHDDPLIFSRDWERLVEHASVEESRFVLLPEMPFAPWFPSAPDPDPVVWRAAVNAHDLWEARLPELSPAVVAGSRPVNRGRRRLNEGFIWEPGRGYHPAHFKYFLPGEEGFWEDRWYDRGDGDFKPLRCGSALAGFMICTEIWFMDRARKYGKDGVHLIVSPRATWRATADKWLAAGRASAVIAGAFCLSSNRATYGGRYSDWGGQGWITGPDGEVLGLTSRERPFVSVDIDLNLAELAKNTYPRYVRD